MRKKLVKIAFKILFYTLLFKLVKKRTPLVVGFRITYRCNSKCSYCYLKKEKKVNELTTNEIKKIIDEMAELGTQRIGFMGGEALLREDFGEIIDYTNSKGIHTSLVSNGYLVPKYLDVIKKLDCLVLSLDGTEKNHDKYRGKGSFEKVMNAIKIVSKENIPLMTISVMSEDTINDIDFILNEAKRYGFYCHFNIMNGLEISNPDLIRKVAVKLAKRKKEGYPITLSTNTLNLLKQEGQEHIPNNSDFDKKDFLNCMAGSLMCNVEPSGIVRSCNFHNLDETLNARKLGFKKVFEKLNNSTHAICAKTCCTTYEEYNDMFNFNPETLFEWAKALKVFN